MAPVADAMSTKNKADSKKQRRKEVAAAIAHHEQAVKGAVRAAEAEADPLRHFGPFAAFARNGLDASIRAVAAPGAPAALTDWALGLCRGNMQQLYEGVWGWSDKKKRRQLIDEASRFLVAYGAAPVAAAAAEGGGDGAAAAAAEPAPIAYVNYRFEVEDGMPVAYCYELQLEEAAQRKGLGKHMMQLLELIAAKYAMAGVMLTVMRANTGALTFYSRLGYREHESSPDVADPEERTGYMILFKPLIRPQQRAAAAAHHHHHGHHACGCC